MLAKSAANSSFNCITLFGAIHDPALSFSLTGVYFSTSFRVFLPERQRALLAEAVKWFLWQRRERVNWMQLKLFSMLLIALLYWSRKITEMSSLTQSSSSFTVTLKCLPSHLVATLLDHLSRCLCRVHDGRDGKTEHFGRAGPEVSCTSASDLYPLTSCIAIPPT